MRISTLCFICLLSLYSCKEKYASFGKDITADDAIIAKSMAAHYATMQEGDSINSKMKAKVIEVCQTKGCWMTLDIGEDKHVMVQFKDYGFFVPKDIEGKAVIVNGIAYVDEISVEDQKHYAEDANASAETIAAINKPKKTYAFEADGVLVEH